MRILLGCVDGSGRVPHCADRGKSVPQKQRPARVAPPGRDHLAAVPVIARRAPLTARPARTWPSCKDAIIQAIQSAVRMDGRGPGAGAPGQRAGGGQRSSHGGAQRGSRWRRAARGSASGVSSPPPAASSRPTGAESWRGRRPTSWAPDKRWAGGASGSPPPPVARERRAERRADRTVTSVSHGDRPSSRVSGEQSDEQIRTVTSVSHGHRPSSRTSPSSRARDRAERSSLPSRASPRACGPRPGLEDR